MEHGDDAILLLDAGWRVRIWSGGAERMYGRPEDKVIGRDVDEAVGVATVAEDRAADRRFVVAEGGGGGSSESPEQTAHP